MSEEPGRRDWTIGFAAGALVGGVLAIILLGVAGLGAMLYFRAQPDEDSLGPKQSAGRSAGGPADQAGGSAEDDAAPDEDDGTYPARYLLVKLAGLTGKGEVRYLLDDRQECVGDAALIKALQDLIVRDQANPEADVDVLVDLDVATAAGIKQAQVDAAVRACWAAGAAVLAPPDLSKEGGR